MAAALISGQNKRKLEASDQEDGEVQVSSADVEMGEVVEGNKAADLVGDNWEEVIEGGKTVKMRKLDAPPESTGT